MCTSPILRPDRIPFKCGQCIECRLVKRRELAIRIEHEATMRGPSTFVTLTYDDDHLPQHGQLRKRDLQLFLMRLRKSLGGVGQLRYVAVGEYGERTLRPHFHAIIFGQTFADDRFLYQRSHAGDLYFSKFLAKSWTYGVHTIADYSFDCGSYMAKYLVKQERGAHVVPRLLFADPDTGEVVRANPEFRLASKGHRAGQGIGASWFREFFMSDVYPHGSVVTSKGSRAPVPRYYKELLKEVGTDMAFDLSARIATRFATERPFDLVEQSEPRRAARERVSLAAGSRFKGAF